MYDVVSVDDIDFNLILIENVLRKIGLKVKSYLDPLEALDNIVTDAPKIVILDYHMPNMHGIELKEKMAEIYDAKYILLTAHGHPHLRKQAHEAGFDLYLTKPLNINHLKEFLASINM